MIVLYCRVKVKMVNMSLWKEEVAAVAGVGHPVGSSGAISEEEDLLNGGHAVKMDRYVEVKTSFP